MRNEGNIETDGFKLKYHSEGSGPDVVVGGNIAGIYYVATLPNQRGKGYGTAMMQHLLSRAKQKDYRLAGLEASSEGINIYNRL